MVNKDTMKVTLEGGRIVSICVAAISFIGIVATHKMDKHIELRPLNLGLLALLTLGLTWVTADFCVNGDYSLEQVVQACIMTVMLVGGITMFVSFKIKSGDKFTVQATIFPMYIAAFVGFGIFGGIYGFDKNLTLAVCSVIVFGLFLLCDIHYMMSGKQVGYTYDKDSDIQACASIFTDMILIFLSMLIVMMDS
jgi:hypothetical protein